jgi:hypothetical protein
MYANCLLFGLTVDKIMSQSETILFALDGASSFLISLGLSINQVETEDISIYKIESCKKFLQMFFELISHTSPNLTTSQSSRVITFSYQNKIMLLVN